MKLKFLLPLIVAFISGQAWSKNCRDTHKIFGTVNLDKTSWETLNVSQKKTRICYRYEPMNANLEITYQSGKKKESSKIFSSLLGFYDYKNAKGELDGGTFPMKQILIESWAPSWYKGSTVKVIEIESKKILAEAKL